MRPMHVALPFPLSISSSFPLFSFSSIASKPNPQITKPYRPDRIRSQNRSLQSKLREIRSSLFMQKLKTRPSEVLQWL
ncbi:hypothetical protein Syun_011846 [Stephania yunnanensis]|uniref:Uncharacterized protein n=1 Tax=Stephania yunnanensis TaxID=152371 RepID=A0AAP0JYB4_9MAGN